MVSRYLENIGLPFPDIGVTDRQIDLMLHAIGADNKPCRKHKDNLYYHAYRNYYDAGGG